MKGKLKMRVVYKIVRIILYSIILFVGHEINPTYYTGVALGMLIAFIYRFKGDDRND